MNRMYQVIVVGGFALTAPMCGGTIEIASQGATSGGTGGRASASASSSTGFGGFPEETGMAAPTSTGVGGFPSEGPAMTDAGSDAAPFDASDGSPYCFPPEETAFACPDGSIPPPVDAGGDGAIGDASSAPDGFPAEAQ